MRAIEPIRGTCLIGLTIYCSSTSSAVEMHGRNSFAPFSVAKPINNAAPGQP
jgi:hypothetical protein